MDHTLNMNLVTYSYNYIKNDYISAIFDFSQNYPVCIFIFYYLFQFILSVFLSLLIVLIF